MASILEIVIILNEFLRKRNVKPFDLMSSVNLLFFLSFVITFFSIYFLKIDFPAWTYLVEVNNTSPFTALLYVIIGYMALLVGVKFIKSCRFVKRLPNEFYIDSSSMEKFAHIIGILSVIFLAIFMYSVGEFSFSFYSLANAVENSFFNGIPRLFFDFILGILNLLSSAFLPFNVPQTATQPNTESFLNMSGIPVDIISLVRVGVAGIILITFLFGALISILEKILANKNNLMVVFYVQFIFFVSLRGTYAGPTNVLKNNVCLFVAFLFFILLFRKKQIAKKSNYQLKVGN
ncbi:hypothetical protein GLV94_13560 [Virgibacillus halodenitrificans]|uniref:hypothetical protein n=1 Tax=Virgibacillus halodenitrificans TaxID=1482 RepID=UPI00136D7C7A|nr:hypothetical protein [Virgibacillus halodenitrificans]MYL46672.1 hypothetical protein [Virgibacillus halodenitrificans]